MASTSPSTGDVFTSLSTGEVFYQSEYWGGVLPVISTGDGFNQS